MELRDREALAEGFEERADERLRARRYRLRFFLQGLSILSALLCSTVVLILAGGLAEERVIVGTVTRPAVAGPPTLPEVMPGSTRRLCKSGSKR